MEQGSSFGFEAVHVPQQQIGFKCCRTDEDKDGVHISPCPLQDARDNYAQLLEKEQKELGYSLREVAERQRSVAQLETTIQNWKTTLQNYVQETKQKAADLAMIEATYKQRLAALKAEQKTAKTMQ